MLCTQSVYFSAQLVGRLGIDGVWDTDYATVTGTRITGGGSGYAALLPQSASGARGRSSVLYGTRLGDLEENWFILFSN
jgi:hypothetical protein